MECVLRRGAGRGAINADYPQMLESLEDLYGGGVLPPELWSRRSR
jgi:hypothetical protein